MNRNELHHKCLSNSQLMDFYLHVEYDNFIQKEYQRIVGGEYYKEITDIVLSAVRIRLHEIAMDCDICMLVFDCLRKEIISKGKKNGNFNFIVNPSILKEIEQYINYEYSSSLFEILLPLLTKKQLRYFLDRYYYLNDLKINKRYERLFSQLFKGKGIASARFEYFKIIPNKTNVIPYTLYIDHLDFRKIEILSDGSIIFLSDRLSNMPILYKLWERQYRISKYTIIVLIILLFLCVLVCLFHFLAT